MNFNLLNGVTMSEALIVTLFSMGTVFLTLLVISFILDGFRALFYKKDKKQSNTPAIGIIDPKDKSGTNNSEVEGYEDEEDLVAVITAAIATSLARPITGIRIRNIKRISQDTPIWARAGRQEQLFTK